MDIRKTKTCERCKNVVPLEQVRLYPKSEDQNLVLCESCCNEAKKQASGHVVGSRVPKLAPAEIVMYKCTRCNYVFKADSSKAGVTYNLNCPYCGKNDRLEKKR